MSRGDGGAAFKVGDRVRIKSLPGYIPSERQGLIVGNTATVVEAGDGYCLIRTDNAKEAENPLTPNGWAFFAADLAPLRPSLLSRFRDLLSRKAVRS